MADQLLPAPESQKRICPQCFHEFQVDNNLRDVIKKMAYELFTCMKCKKINPERVYFCFNNHCYCINCIASKCLKCDLITEFSEGTQLKNVTVTCDWPKCNQNISLVNYINHKRDCFLRPYKCPLRECQVTVHSIAELKTHWHCRVPELIYNTYVIEYNTNGIYEFYWLLNKELYHVLVDFSQKKADILIEDINVLPNNNKFYFKGFCSGYEKWDDHLKLSNVGGKYRFIKENYYPFEKIHLIRVL